MGLPVGKAGMENCRAALLDAPTGAFPGLPLGLGTVYVSHDGTKLGPKGSQLGLTDGSRGDDADLDPEGATPGLPGGLVPALHNKALGPRMGATEGQAYTTRGLGPDGNALGLSLGSTEGDVALRLYWMQPPCFGRRASIGQRFETGALTRPLGGTRARTAIGLTFDSALSGAWKFLATI
jgi:hypothetical protein